MRSIFAAALLAGVAATASAQAPPPGAPPMGPPGHERFDIDANHDGVLTRAEALAAADARFKRLDANHDGKLTKDEFDHRSEMQAAADERFKRLDKNNDGELSKDEFDHRGPPGGPPPEGAAPGGPPGAEGPGHGWGGRGPMMHGRLMGRMGGEMADQHFDAMLAEWDRNHDGALELAEFRAEAQARFDAMDGNHDGKVKLPEHKGPPPGGWRGHGEPGEAAPPPPKAQ